MSKKFEKAVIELVPSRPEFAEHWLEWRAQANTIRYNPIAQSTVEELRERMERMGMDFSDLAAADEFQYFFRLGQELVGSATLKNISQTMAYGEIGYQIAEKFQGQGVGTKSIASFVAKIFSETRLRRLMAYVAEDNIASCRLLEKVGFVKEGLLREHYLIDAKPTNEVVYAILRADWERSHEAAAPVRIEQPRLETARLILEPYKESDLPDVLKYASHPDVSRYVPWEFHKTLEDTKSFYKFIMQSTRKTRGRLFFVFAVRLKETGRVIGSFDFKNITPSCGQIDYALGYENWNKGLITEAAEAVKCWAFNTLPEMVRLQAFCVCENVGSARVMEKIGMQKEGIRRKAFVLKGQPVNITDYALIRD